MKPTWSVDWDDPEARRRYMKQWKNENRDRHRIEREQLAIRQNATPLAKKCMVNEFRRSYVRYSKSKHPQSVRFQNFQALGA